MVVGNAIKQEQLLDKSIDRMRAINRIVLALIFPDLPLATVKAVYHSVMVG